MIQREDKIPANTKYWRLMEALLLIDTKGRDQWNRTGGEPIAGVELLWRPELRVLGAGFL